MAQRNSSSESVTLAKLCQSAVWAGQGVSLAEPKHLMRMGRGAAQQKYKKCLFGKTRSLLRVCRSADVEAELKHLAAHMAQWRILGHDVAVQDFALMALYAKHRCASLVGCSRSCLPPASIHRRDLTVARCDQHRCMFTSVQNTWRVWPAGVLPCLWCLSKRIRKC